jgi:hypothetical protein
VKTRKNHKYGSYLYRLQEREELIDSLIGFWLGKETIEDAITQVEKIHVHIEEALEGVDEIASISVSNCGDLYTKNDIVKIANQVKETLCKLHYDIPEWQQRWRDYSGGSSGKES